MSAALLLLADGRLPIGGHAHSAGIESAWREGRVQDLDDVEAFVMGRLHTVGLTDASLTSALVSRLTVPASSAASPAESVAAIDAEVGARIVAAPLRSASRRLGRQLVRVASGWCSSAGLEAARLVNPAGPHQVTAAGATASAMGLSPVEAATLSLFHQVNTPIQAAVKLGGLDPFKAATVAASFSGQIDELAAKATALAETPLADMPCDTGPVSEIAAILHDEVSDRLFAT